VRNEHTEVWTLKRVPWDKVDENWPVFREMRACLAEHKRKTEEKAARRAEEKHKIEEGKLTPL
jgi:hypothetical protein